MTQRVVVVGGGVAGVSAAWLLDGACAVTLLESERRLGGHAQTVRVSVNQRPIDVDAGAQYFGPKSHPVFWRLLTEVLDVPTIPAPMNLTVHAHGRRPALVSPDNRRLGPLFQPRYWPALHALAVFVAAARKLETTDDWTTTAEQFIERLPVARSARVRVLYPMTGAMFGFTVPQVKQMSARAVVAFVVRGQGDGLLAPFDYHNAAGGLGAVVEALTRDLTTVEIRTGAAATRLVRDGTQWQVHDATGAVHTADHVVLTLPPYAAAPLIARLAGGEPLAGIHTRFPYLPAKVALHTDPAYMPADRRHRSGYNVLSDGDFCEPTMAFGAFRPGDDVFKSWISNRRELPRDIIETFEYRHAHETPAYAAAQRALAAHQGERNLWFAGTHTLDVSSQENALVSAMRVAERLAPDTARLKSLTDGPRSG